MPEQTPAAKPFVFNDTEFKAVIKEKEAKLLETAGKPGHNPYMQIAQKLQPLLDRYNNNERTEALMKDAKAVVVEATQVCTMPEPEKKEPPKPPGGLNLGTK